jgi:hypothetical protein
MEGEGTGKNTLLEAQRKPELHQVTIKIAMPSCPEELFLDRQKL